MAHTGVIINNSTVRKRLIEGRKKISVTMKKVLFSDDSHFLVQGQQSRFVRKTVKHPSKKMFWDVLFTKIPDPLQRSKA